MKARKQNGIVSRPRSSFKDLMATKKMFIVPAFIFFVVYYFALPVLVGYAPNFMATKVIGRREPRLSFCPLAVFHGLDSSPGST